MKMTLINFGLAVAFALGLVLMAADIALPYPFPSLMVSISYITLWAVQPILVYKWSKEYNKKLENLTTLNT
jgi:hypothetical protein